MNFLFLYVCVYDHSVDESGWECIVNENFCRHIGISVQEIHRTKKRAKVGEKEKKRARGFRFNQRFRLLCVVPILFVIFIFFYIFLLLLLLLFFLYPFSYQYTFSTELCKHKSLPIFFHFGHEIFSIFLSPTQLVTLFFLLLVFFFLYFSILFFFFPTLFPTFFLQVFPLGALLSLGTSLFFVILRPRGDNRNLVSDWIYSA